MRDRLLHAGENDEFIRNAAVKKGGERPKEIGLVRTCFSLRVSSLYGSTAWTQRSHSIDLPIQRWTRLFLSGKIVTMVEFQYPDSTEATRK